MKKSNKSFIVGNWKMNPTKKQDAFQLVQGLLSTLKKNERSFDIDGAQCVIMPPSLYISEVEHWLKSSSIQLGAQSAHWKDSGAVTGELSISMLNDYNVRYLLVGHSERRTLFSETNAMIARQFKSAIQHKISPILCIGESLADKKSGQTLNRLIEQCESVVNDVGINVFNQTCIAYEPVWAIGTGITPTPDEVQMIHYTIREWFSKRDEKVANSLSILYGGSLNQKNANDFFSQPDINGGLIGGASLSAEHFLKIYSFLG
jgi:triosephosphate isomerase